MSGEDEVVRHKSLETLFEEVRKLAEPLTEEQKLSLFRDHRRKTKAPEGIIVGSNEYWKWWRETNRERVRLYQRRAYLKRRKLGLAASRAVDNNTTLEDELKEVDEQISSLREFASQVEPPVKPVVVEDGQIPFVAEEAARLCISYVDCLTFMQSDDYRGEESWETESGKKLLEIFRLSAVTAASAKR